MYNIKISNIIYDSFQEYQGECSLVLFLSHCNLACSLCYNYPYYNTEMVISAKEAIDLYLRPNHTAVVFLGGEPTVWEYLPELIEYVKDKGLKTKLYTNGQKPSMIAQCAKYLDAVSIDFKAFSNVSKIIGKDIKDYKYKHNIFLCISKLKDYNKYIEIEVRTTKWEGVEYREIGKMLHTIWPEIPHILQEAKVYNENI